MVYVSRVGSGEECAQRGFGLEPLHPAVTMANQN